MINDTAAVVLVKLLFADVANLCLYLLCLNLRSLWDARLDVMN